MTNWAIRRLKTTASTNDDARQAAEAGATEGLVIHALKQTAGRGRHGRVWESPEGNLYCSVLLCPPGARRDYGVYSFVAALALADTVQEFLPEVSVTLKWPNDVLMQGKKIAGILLESGDDFLVIGMGLNIRYHPQDALYPATSMIEAGADIPLPLAGGVRRGRGVCHLDQNPNLGKPLTSGPPPAPPASGRGAHRASFDSALILQKLLRHLSLRYEIIKTEGFAVIRAAWLERAQKGSMSVKLPNETVTGAFADIDPEGRLILRLADGAERAIATGDVFYI